MMQASSCTTPLAFGSPPRPTDVFVGSASAFPIPSTMASSAEPPEWSLARPASFAGLPNGQVDTKTGGVAACPVLAGSTELSACTPAEPITELQARDVAEPRRKRRRLREIDGDDIGNAWRQ